jgi:hypothetical protein
LFDVKNLRLPKTLGANALDAAKALRAFAKAAGLAILAGALVPLISIPNGEATNKTLIYNNKVAWSSGQLPSGVSGSIGEDGVEQTGKALIKFGAAQGVNHLAPRLRRFDQSRRTQQLEMVGQRAPGNRLAWRGTGAGQPLGRRQPRDHAQPVGIGERVQRQIERHVFQPGVSEAGHGTDIGKLRQFNSSV